MSARSTTPYGDRRDLSRGCGRSGWQTLGGRRSGWSARLARAPEPPSSPFVTVQEAAHDDATVSFLLRQSLREREEEEEWKEEVRYTAELWEVKKAGKKAEVEQARFNADVAEAVELLCMRASRRKRKKRRRRRRMRTRRTSFRRRSRPRS